MNWPICLNTTKFWLISIFFPHTLSCCVSCFVFRSLSLSNPVYQLNDFIKWSRFIIRNISWEKLDSKCFCENLEPYQTRTLSYDVIMITKCGLTVLIVYVFPSFSLPEKLNILNFDQIYKKHCIYGIRLISLDRSLNIFYNKLIWRYKCCKYFL